MAESNIESFATRTGQMYAVASAARRSSSQNTQLLEDVEQQGDMGVCIMLETWDPKQMSAPVFMAAQAALIRSTLLAAGASELK
jgi:hypothetical protein